MLDVQRATERAENAEARRFQELKMRKLMEFVRGDWTYREDLSKVERMGAKEEWSLSQGHDQARQGKRAQHLKELQKQLALKEIAERHITEFAGDQHTDFANVLGLPEVTAADLFKKQAAMDPLAVDAIREHSHFSKQIEGYPWFFANGDASGQSTGLHTTGHGLTDFFESFCSITRIHAACEQAFAELSSFHRPENGVAAACLEAAMLAEAHGCLKTLRSEKDSGPQGAATASSQLADDFYLSSSDKLVFLMRELKSELHPDCIATRANPLLVAKLAPREVAKYDFPRLTATEIVGPGEVSDEVLAEKMVAAAKVSIARRQGEEEAQAAVGGSASVGRESEDEAAKEKQVKSPSLLSFACNTVEVVRLRHDLVQITHETEVLSAIYRGQLERTGKGTWKLVGRDPIPFETQSISKESMNLVDLNDGSRLALGLAAGEFDATLGASMDFRSESCVKALMTDLGVEELRAVLHYELM